MRFAFIALTACFAVPLAAQEQLINGDFETGDFTGWTLTEPANQVINDGTVIAGGSGAAQAPIAGSFDALTNGGGPGQRFFSQTVSVPANLGLATLSWTDQINNFAVFSDPNQEWRILIKDTGGTVISEVFSTNPGDAAIQPVTNRSFDVTNALLSLAGQQAVISFEEEDNLFFFNVYLDDCSLVFQTGSDFASFSTYGAGCGAGAGGSFYEQWDGAGDNLDMQGGGFSMIFNGTSYDVVGPINPIVPPTSPPLGAGDDAIINAVLPTTGPWAAGFLTPVGFITSVDIDTNGSVYFELGAASDFTESVPEFLNGLSRVAPCFADWSPNAGGALHAEQDAGNGNLFHITWAAVPNFGGTGVADMQVTLDAASLIVEVKYGAGMTASGNPGGIAGFSTGTSADNGESDISVDTGAGIMLGSDDLALGLQAQGTSRPVLGQIFTMEVTNVPASAVAAAILLFSGQQPPGTLPLDILGLTGCELLVAGSPITNIALAAGPGTQAGSLDLTNAGPSLAGLNIYAQGAVIGVTTNPFGAALSNGGDLLLNPN